jgi:hypothetical protein
MADILVLGPTGEQFVADGQHGGCDNDFVRHEDIQDNAQSARSKRSGIGSAVCGECKRCFSRDRRTRRILQMKFRLRKMNSAF